MIYNYDFANSIKYLKNKICINSKYFITGRFATNELKRIKTSNNCKDETIYIHI